MLALKLLDRRASVLAERCHRLRDGLQRTEDWVRGTNEYVDWVRPDAGAICCIRLKASAFNDAAVPRFYEAALRQGVRVANGLWFGDEMRVFRLGFGLPSMPDLDHALTVLGTALDHAASHNGGS